MKLRIAIIWIISLMAACSTMRAQSIRCPAPYYPVIAQGVNSSGYATPWFCADRLGNLFSNYSTNKTVQNVDQFMTNGVDIGSAVNASAAALGANCGTLVMPAGAFTYSTPISITKPCRLIGAGKAATVLTYTPTNSDGITVNVVHASVVASTPTLEDFSLIGPGSGTGNGITLTSGYQTYAKNVLVKLFGVNGWNIVSSGSTVNTDSSVFLECEGHSNGQYGFFLSPQNGDANLITIIGGSAFLNTLDGYYINSNWTNLQGPDGSYNLRYGFNFNAAQNTYGYAHAEQNTTQDVIFGASSAYNFVRIPPAQHNLDNGSLNTFSNQPGGAAPVWTNFNVSQFLINGILVDSLAAPTLSGFGTTPCIGRSSSGTTCTGTPTTQAFVINVGTGGTASTGTIIFPTNTGGGWSVHCDDVTTKSTSVSQTQQTSFNTNGVGLTQYSDVHVATAWVASDILVCQARGF